MYKETLAKRKEEIQNAIMTILPGGGENVADWWTQTNFLLDGLAPEDCLEDDALYRKLKQLVMISRVRNK